MLKCGNSSFNILTTVIENRNSKKYYLCLSKDTNIPQNSIVGEFKHKEDKIFSVYIVLDDNRVKNVNHREMCVASNVKNEEGKSFNIIFITKNALKKLQSLKWFLSSLWHELGHIHNKDFMNFQKYPSNKTIGQLRKEAIENNSVIECELKADEFAIQHVGCDNYIKFLEEAIKERLRYGDKAMRLAIKEMQLRIKNIQEIKKHRVNKGIKLKKINYLVF